MQTFFFFLSFGSAGGISHAPQQLRQPDVFADRRARSYLLTEIEGSTQLSVSARKVTIGTIMLEGEFEILNFTAPPTTPPLSPKGTFWSGNRFISCASSHHFGYSPTTFFFLPYPEYLSLHFRITLLNHAKVSQNQSPGPGRDCRRPDAHSWGESGPRKPPLPLPRRHAAFD